MNSYVGTKARSAAVAPTSTTNSVAVAAAGKTTRKLDVGSTSTLETSVTGHRWTPDTSALHMLAIAAVTGCRIGEGAV